MKALEPPPRVHTWEMGRIVHLAKWIPPQRHPQKYVNVRHKLKQGRPPLHPPPTKVPPRKPWFLKGPYSTQASPVPCGVPNPPKDPSPCKYRQASLGPGSSTSKYLEGCMSQLLMVDQWHALYITPHSVCFASGQFCSIQTPSS